MGSSSGGVWQVYNTAWLHTTWKCEVTHLGTMKTSLDQYIDPGGLEKRKRLMWGTSWPTEKSKKKVVKNVPKS